MNREELYDALVRLCQQVGITTEATYKRLHNAVDSSGMSPTRRWFREELHVQDEGYGQFRCR
jgi:hypothetical protein